MATRKELIARLRRHHEPAIAWEKLTKPQLQEATVRMDAKKATHAAGRSRTKSRMQRRHGVR